MEENDLLVSLHGVDLCQEEDIVLKDVLFEVKKGEFIYLIGKVGSGKSSLLKSLYAEVTIKTGEAMVMGHNLRKLKRRDIPKLRRKMGIIFQDFKLLMDRTIEDNLRFVLKATGWKNKQQIKSQIDLVLKAVGMDNKGYKMPHQLSGGEQQRIAIARALLNSPELIVADEPTGNLDADTANEIVQLLHDICKSGTAVIMATHNQGFLTNYPARTLHCESGLLSEN